MIVGIPHMATALTKPKKTSLSTVAGIPPNREISSCTLIALS